MTKEELMNELMKTSLKVYGKRGLKTKTKAELEDMYDSAISLGLLK